MERSALAGRRILVTGAEGRIGTATCAHLSALGASVTALSLPAEGEQVVEQAADRVLHGDTRDDEVVQQALEGVELVVHLAAIPAPHLADWTTVFSTNVVSTFTVLAHAGERGVRRAVIASSINAYGGPFNSRDVLPAYYPLDERLPADLDDPDSAPAGDRAAAAAGLTGRRFAPPVRPSVPSREGQRELTASATTRTPSLRTPVPTLTIRLGSSPDSSAPSPLDITQT